MGEVRYKGFTEISGTRYAWTYTPQTQRNGSISNAHKITETIECPECNEEIERQIKKLVKSNQIKLKEMDSLKCSSFEGVLIKTGRENRKLDGSDPAKILKKIDQACSSHGRHSRSQSRSGSSLDEEPFLPFSPPSVRNREQQPRYVSEVPDFHTHSDQSSRKEVLQQKKLVARYNQQLKQLEAQLDEAQAAYEELYADSDARVDKIISKQQKIGELKTQLLKTQTQSQNDRELIGTTKAKIETLKAKLSLVESQKNEAIQQSENLKSDLEKFRQEVKDREGQLEADLAIANARVDDLQTQLQKSTQYGNEVENQRKKIWECWNASETLVKKFQAQATTHGSDLNALHQKLEAEQERSTLLKSEIDTLTLQLTQAQVDYQSQEKQYNDAVQHAQTIQVKLDLVRQKSSSKVLLLESQIQVAEQQVASATSNAKQLSQQLETAKESLQSAESQSDQLRNDIQKLKDELAQLQNRSEQQRAKLQTQNDALQEEITQLKSAQEQSKSDYEESLRKATDELNTLKNLCDQLKFEKEQNGKTLTDQLNSLQEELTKTKELKDRVEAKIGNLEKQNSSLNTENETARSELESLNKRLKELQKNYDQLSQQLQAEGKKSNNQLKALQGKLDEANQKISGLKKKHDQEMQKIRLELDSKQQKIEKLKRLNKAQAETIAVLQNEISEVKLAKDAALNRVKDLENRLEAAEAKANSESQKIQKLESEKIGLNKDKKSLLGQIDVLKNEKEQQQLELQLTKEVNEKLESQLKTSKEEYKKITDSLNGAAKPGSSPADTIIAIRQELADKGHEIATLQGQLDEANRNIVDLKKRITSLEKGLEELEKMIATKNEEIVALQGQIQILKRRYAQNLLLILEKISTEMPPQLNLEEITDQELQSLEVAVQERIEAMSTDANIANAMLSSISEMPLDELHIDIERLKQALVRQEGIDPESLAGKARIAQAVIEKALKNERNKVPEDKLVGFTIQNDLRQSLVELGEAITEARKLTKNRKNLLLNSLGKVVEKSYKPSSHAKAALDGLRAACLVKNPDDIVKVGTKNVRAKTIVGAILSDTYNQVDSVLNRNGDITGTNVAPIFHILVEIVAIADEAKNRRKTPKISAADSEKLNETYKLYIHKITDAVKALT